MLIDLKGFSVCNKPRSDGRYQGYVMQNGEKVYFYGKTRDEVCYKVARCLREGKVEKKKINKHIPSFKEYAEKWIELYKVPNLKMKSLRTLRSSLKRAIDHYSETKITQMTSDDIQEFLLGIKAKRIRDLCRMYMNQLFKKALKTGIVKRNPCEAIEIKRMKYKKKPALTIEQFRCFLAAADNTPYRLLYRFLSATGMRIGEALALRKSDIDFENYTVSVTKDVVFDGSIRIEQDTPKTDAANRTLPLSKDICKCLAEVEGDLIFPHTYNAVHCSIRRIAKKLNIPVTLHVLRHTYATRLEEAGVPPKIKQYLLGHASLEMTQNVYTDTQQEYIDSVSDKIRGLLPSKPTDFDT